MQHAIADDSRFFRIAGPTTSQITALSSDGYLTWTNPINNGTYTVQTARLLAGASNWVDYIQFAVSNYITTVRIFDLTPPNGMALIPAGSFTMGDSLDGNSLEVPLHSVYVSAFYMDQYDVTLSLWRIVYQWATNHGYTFDYSGSGKAANHPVQYIDWYDCVKWCNARSEKEGRIPAYYTDSTQTAVYRTGVLNLSNSWVNWSSGYRLPTEAEWEKAARGGLRNRRFPWGDTISWSVANYYAYPSQWPYDVNPTQGYDPAYNDGVYPYTSPVNAFVPNGYGLYDMAGNLWQWCWDWFGSYGSASQTDPRGASSGPDRVQRGGAWFDDAVDCRSASRNIDYPADRSYSVGFRSVLPSS